MGWFGPWGACGCCDGTCQEDTDCIVSPVPEELYATIPDEFAPSACSSPRLGGTYVLKRAPGQLGWIYAPYTDPLLIGNCECNYPLNAGIDTSGVYFYLSAGIMCVPNPGVFGPRSYCVIRAVMGVVSFQSPGGFRSFQHWAYRVNTSTLRRSDWWLPYDSLFSWNRICYAYPAQYMYNNESWPYPRAVHLFA